MTTRIRLLSYLACMAGLLSPSAVLTVQADLSTNEQQYYAQRFRPYIKTDTSHDDFDDCELFPNVHPADPTEPHHPCNWEWFVGNCYLVRGYHSIQCDFGPLVRSQGTGDPRLENQWPDGTIVLPPGSLVAPYLWELRAQQPSSDVRYAGGQDFGWALESNTKDNWKGEDWTNVIYNGHGIYAHVEEVPKTTLINIEYTILWAYNSAMANMHNGDLTTMTCVYDKGCDLLTRVTYLAHGAILQSYRTAQPQVNLWNLSGLDENESGVCVRVAQLNISYNDAATVLQGPCAGSSEICSPNCTASDPYLYFAYDPDTCRYEHPVVFAEYASHEFWPNPSGSACTAPAHGGNGVSFLPSNVQVLGTLANPVPEHEPFLFYNGLMGTDPKGIIFHGTWYWPNGLLYGIPTNRIDDPSPYRQRGNLPWPPAQEFTNGPPTVYVDWRASGNGTASSPFPDVGTGCSFVPLNGIISVTNGIYTGPPVISRPCTIVSDGGTVTITGGAPLCLGPYVSYRFPLYVTIISNSVLYSGGNRMTVVSGTSPSTAVWQVRLTGLSGLQTFPVNDGDWNWTAPPLLMDNWMRPYYPSWFYPDDNGNITITYDPSAYSDGWYPAQGRIGVSTDPGHWWLYYWSGGSSDWSSRVMKAVGGGIYELDVVIPNPTKIDYFATAGTNSPTEITALGFSYHYVGISGKLLYLTTTVPNQEVEFFVNAYAGLIKAVVK
jgi:hypothetical protein